MMQRLAKHSHLAAVATTVLWMSWERQNLREKDAAISALQSNPTPPVFNSSLPYQYSLFYIASTICESSRHTIDTSQDIPTPSRFRRALAAMHLSSLPMPRRLIKNDPVFSDASLKRGLRQRARDEVKLRKLQERVVQAVAEKRGAEYIRSLHDEFCQVAYGKDVTPQEREDFVIRYGCTGWTDDVLNTLVDLADTRGFVEIGAGNGQWARALAECYRDGRKLGGNVYNNKAFEFVLAYDDMSELPLSPEIYHEHTQPAHDYFYSRVQKSDSIDSVLRQWPCRGRVLLLVYPSPGPMAVDAVKAYSELGFENDTVVYVGEGRGGANASDALFDYFENGEWAILDVLPVKPQPGDKGYEKLYVLQKIKTDELEEFYE